MSEPTAEERAREAHIRLDRCGACAPSWTQNDHCGERIAIILAALCAQREQDCREVEKLKEALRLFLHLASDSLLHGMREEFEVLIK